MATRSRLADPLSRVFADRDRWLALGLLLLALALAYGVLVHPWWTAPMLAADAKIDSLQQRELRLRMQLQQAPEVAERLQQVRAQQGERPGFLPEASPQLATASLVQRLETVVAQASPGNRSCAITNRSPMPAQEQGRYTRVVVEVRLRCGTPQLMRVLHALESGAPRLFVDNLNVLAQRIYFGRDGFGDNESSGLDVTFDLYGYLAPTPAARAASAPEASDAP